jgi:hypothetical protein
MSASIDDTRASSTGDVRRMLPPVDTFLDDDTLLDELRRNATVSTRHIRADFTEVHTPAKVLGYVVKHRKQFAALRGDDPAWAHEIGRYPSESLAVEALRMRRA